MKAFSSFARVVCSLQRFCMLSLHTLTWTMKPVDSVRKIRTVVRKGGGRNAKVASFVSCQQALRSTTIYHSIRRGPHHRYFVEKCLVKLGKQ